VSRDILSDKRAELEKKSFKRTINAENCWKC
jgi:hypothetical protein